MNKCIITVFSIIVLYALYISISFGIKAMSDHKNEQLKYYRDVEKARKVIVEEGRQEGRIYLETKGGFITTLEHEGCEYILVYVNLTTNLIHKQNCKFCKAKVNL
jgi:hypothetical protein